MVHGFVEELVVNEDPEYQWIDRIRTPRASNEARQRLISLMSGKNIPSDPFFILAWRKKNVVVPVLPLVNMAVFYSLFRRATEENRA